MQQEEGGHRTRKMSSAPLPPSRSIHSYTPPHEASARNSPATRTRPAVSLLQSMICRFGNIRGKPDLVIAECVCRDETGWSVFLWGVLLTRRVVRMALRPCLFRIASELDPESRKRLGALRYLASAELAKFEVDRLAQELKSCSRIAKI